MFADMKEELAKQQAMFHREWEHAEQDREHTVRELEETKHLNDKLLAQIAVIQNTRVPLSLPERPGATEATSDEQFQSQRRCKAASLLQWSNPTTSQVFLIPAQRIDPISLGGELRHSSVSMISTSLYKSEYATSSQFQGHRHWCIQFSLLRCHIGIRIS